MSFERVLKRVISLHIAGTRGGPLRLRILMLLEKPHNINEIARSLEIDYKTAQHHVRVLHKLGFVVSSGSRYGKDYKIAEIIRLNRHLLNMGKSR